MIFITSYPYVSPKHFAVFERFVNPDNLRFILPKRWLGRAGYYAPPLKDSRITFAPTYFYHSHYPVIRGLLKGWIPSLKKILKGMARLGDILYTANEPNLLVTLFNAYVARSLGMKHVFFTWQNVGYRERLSGWKLSATEWIIRKNIALSSGAICGNVLAERILRAYADPEFKTAVIPISGVDPEQFNPAAGIIPDEYTNLAGSCIIVFAGVLDRRKGVDTLVKAFKLVLSNAPEVRLILIGSGPLERRITRLIETYGIQDKVVMLKWKQNSELPAYFSHADIFAYPSEPYGGWEEQFGYSIAEASASGLPVVSTRIGSIPDVLHNGETGLLVNPGDVEGLASALGTLVGNRDLRQRMGKSGREFIRTRYSNAVIAGAMSEFFSAL
jgi:glycosyltransferase involved in cell wall biosynthesis